MAAPQKEGSLSERSVIYMMLVFCHRDLEEIIKGYIEKELGFDVEEGNPVVEVDNGGIEVRAEVNTKEQAGD